MLPAIMKLTAVAPSEFPWNPLRFKAIVTRPEHLSWYGLCAGGRSLDWTWAETVVISSIMHMVLSLCLI